MYITVVTPPAAEPVMLQELKNWAKVDGTDDDARLTAILTAAIESAEQYTRRSFINRTLKLTLDLPRSKETWTPGVFELPYTYFDGTLPDVIGLPQGPVSSITSVVTYGLDGTASTMSASNYRLSADRFVLADTATWPIMRETGAVEITYVAGYGDTSSSVPMPIKTGIILQAATLMDTSWVCSDSTGMSPAAKQLLNQYKIYGEML